MKRSRSLAAFTRTKRRLIVTIATAAVLLISSCAAVAMVQFYQADYQALEQRGATRKTLDSFRALSTADGLFDMPELGTRNTEESRINATYMVSQMVGENHDKVSTQRTLDSLYAYAKDERNPLAMRLKAYSDWHRAKFLHIPSGDQETLRLQELDSNDRDRWFTDWRVQSDTHLLRL